MWGLDEQFTSPWPVLRLGGRGNTGAPHEAVRKATLPVRFTLPGTLDHRDMTAENRSPLDPLFREGGELGALMRRFDWASTPLGPPSTWPGALRTSVHLMLASKQPMYLGWTPDLIALYNDAYRPILGADKHPAALGARTADIFGQDGYPGLKPVFDAALRGESAAFENLLVPLRATDFWRSATSMSALPRCTSTSTSRVCSPP